MHQGRFGFAARLGLSLLLVLFASSCMQRVTSYKMVAWHHLAWPATISREDAWRIVDRSMREQGFVSGGDGVVSGGPWKPEGSSHPVARHYESKDPRFEALQISFDNASHPDCFSINFGLEADQASELAPMREAEAALLTQFRQLPDWEVGEGPCVYTSTDD